MKIGTMFGLPGISAIFPDRRLQLWPEKRLQLWPCSYIAECSARGFRRRATTILSCLDDQGRFEYQTDACDAHANELYAAFHLPGFGSYLIPQSKVASELQRYDLQFDNRKTFDNRKR